MKQMKQFHIILAMICFLVSIPFAFFSGATWATLMVTGGVSLICSFLYK